MGPSIVAQMLWLTFSALPACGPAVFCQGTNNITWLSLTFPAAYIVISLPVGYLVDARGFRVSVLVGAALLALSGALRPFAPTFPLLLATQAVGALGQPFILNALSKLVRGWFPETEVATATGLGTLSIYLGLALGFGLPPVLAPALGVRSMLELYAGIAVLSFAVFFLVGAERKERPISDRSPTMREMLGSLGIRNIAVLCALFFVGIGIFNSLATYVVPVLGSRGVSASDAGLAGAVLIVGGILGALVMSVIADRYRTLRRPLLLSLLFSVPLWAFLGLVRGTLLEAAGLFVLGFFFMSTLPLGLELSVRSVGPSSEGAANAMVWEFSQIGGTVVVLGFLGFGSAYGWGSTFWLAAGFSALMLGLGALLRAK
ncbi:MAG: MFS transporter [Euryarchaeota archaeon]|nr:MFS transporter [Euryarchaeota archaeon]MDE1837485.1 MFS transporter [Euryarchaeota archaeon]MDE1880559.1 MFS transporter [Euryarchaeota archaeon]MDE2045549.1 MFS transporter [Thermoplasmata archaeon]